MLDPRRAGQRRPVRSPATRHVTGTRSPSPRPAPPRPFQPGWHPVPWLLTQRIRESKFVVLRRSSTLTVQAGPDQPDNLIRLRTTADAEVQAQVVMNSPVGMALGYQKAAPKVARRLDGALRRCEETRDMQPLLEALKQARGELRAARKRFAPPPPPRPRTGIQIVHGGLPSLGKRR